MSSTQLSDELKDEATRLANMRAFDLLPVELRNRLYECTVNIGPLEVHQLWERYTVRMGLPRQRVITRLCDMIAGIERKAYALRLEDEKPPKKKAPANRGEDVYL